jgi:hypothetical protein
VTSAWLLLLVGLGSPAIGLLVGRRLASDDISRSVRRHHEALMTLGEITRSTAQRP